MSGTPEKTTPRPNKPISKMSPEQRAAWVRSLQQAVRDESYGVDPTALAQAVLNWIPSNRFEKPDRKPRQSLFEKRAYQREYMRAYRARRREEGGEGARPGNKP